jgi:hypothetical protein
MLGALVVGAAVVTVGAMLLYKNFGNTGSDAPVSSGQSSSRADARPKPQTTKAEPTEAELQQTEDMPPPKEELVAQNAMKEVKCDISSVGTSICPGLWERTIHMGFKGLPKDVGTLNINEMMEQMKKVDPAAYQKAQAEMAKQGAKLAAGGGMVDQYCVTPEQAKRWAKLIMAAIPQFEECTTITSPLVGKTQKMSFTCPGGNGEAEAVLLSDTATTLTITSHSCGVTTNLQASSRWLGSDCGNVKRAKDCESYGSDATSCAFQHGKPSKKRGC